MMKPAGNMKLLIELTPEQVEALIESEIAELPDAEQWRIRGHGSRSREAVRRAVGVAIAAQIRHLANKPRIDRERAKKREEASGNA